MRVDTRRLTDTTAICLDETLFVREGPYKRKPWSTTVCDVVNHQLTVVLPTRDLTEVAGSGAGPSRSTGSRPMTALAAKVT